MSSLPPGWTSERLKTATADDLRQLPENTLHSLPLEIMSDNDARSIVVKARINESQRSERERLGLSPVQRASPFPPAPESTEPFVQVVEAAGFEDFGFMVFRLDYADEEKWERWQEEFDKILESSMERRGGVERVQDRLMTPLIDDERLQGASWGGVVGSYHEDCKENGAVLSGLDLSMVLALDHEAMMSLLEPASDTKPWIWAVDVTYDFPRESRNTFVGDKYAGYLKVALSSLIPDLYPLLAGSGMKGVELWLFAKPIWESALKS